MTYLSQDSLIAAIRSSKLTLAYFDGKYPTPLYDYEEEYLGSLAKNEAK